MSLSTLKKKKIVIWSGLLLLLFIFTSALVLKKTNTQLPSIISPSNDTQSQTQLETNSWETYTNTKYNFTLEHPASIASPENNSDFGYLGSKIFFSSSPTNPLDCTENCPVVNKTETVTIASQQATKVEGYVEIDGNSTQEFVTYIFSSNDGYLSFTLKAGEKTSDQDVPSTDPIGPTQTKIQETDKTLFTQIVSSYKSMPKYCPDTCPQLMPPHPEFCKDGTIVKGEIDQCGCQKPPICKKEAARTSPPKQIGCVISGCNSEICADKQMNSICIYREEFACYKKAVCELQTDGNCGWTQTEGSKSCFEEFKS